jgi:hypothetical protein
MSGKVYFVVAPGRIKIGYTLRPERRLAQLQAMDMERLEVMSVVNGSRADEGGLHEMLADHRLRGEWFTDNDQVREIISKFIAGEIKFIREPAPEPIAPPVSAASEVVDVAMGELRFLLDEIERRQATGIPSSDLVWFAKFLTDDVIDPLTAYRPSIDYAGDVVRQFGGKNRSVAGG